MSADAPEKLGLTLTQAGANVAIHAPDAERVELCLFDAAGAETRHALTRRTGPVWHDAVPGVAEGARYGIRAHGPWSPRDGLRFNGAKLLIDPHAVMLDSIPRLHPSMSGHCGGDSLARDDGDSAAHVAKAVATALPAWPEAAARPVTPWARTVIYELHVRGFTRLHPQIPPELRGTFAALAHPAAIAHLTALGITAVEVMPCAAWIEERHLARLGLTNYWGYNPVAFCAPDPRLAPGGWAEVRQAIAALADAGIETIIDVVLNHTGEGDELGPTVSLRGLDNAGYYRLRADDRARYVDDTGCGHALACDRPHVVRLCMDALRAWARAGVHGFRFDLGTTLGRRDAGFDAAAPLLAAISQDPLLRGLKLIAEPWDLGDCGYRLGQFPALWGEWNDRFRDGARRFWRGDAGMLGDVATRLAGSADVLAGKRRPSRSVNFIAAHDGFTLADLVSYEQRRNAANGEDGRDGSADNHSWNCGTEGPSDDPAVQAARQRDQVALLATLLFARGTPMLPMGAELGQSQQGNNNAYCQDGALSWLDWSGTGRGLMDATAALVRARLAHPALHDDRFLSGTAEQPGRPPDVAWLGPDGAPMTPERWDDPAGASLLMVLTLGPDRVAVALNRGREAAPLGLPPPRSGCRWELECGDGGADGLLPRSVSLFAERPAGSE